MGAMAAIVGASVVQTTMRCGEKDRRAGRGLFRLLTVIYSGGPADITAAARFLKRALRACSPPSSAGKPASDTSRPRKWATIPQEIGSMLTAARSAQNQSSISVSHRASMEDPSSSGGWRFAQCFGDKGEVEDITEGMPRCLDLQPPHGYRERPSGSFIVCNYHHSRHHLHGRIRLHW